jgi:hypothetical protein
MIRFKVGEIDLYIEFKHKRRNGNKLTICKLIQYGKERNKVWGSGTSEGLNDAPREERLKISYLRAVRHLDRGIRKPAGEAFFNRHLTSLEEELAHRPGQSLGAMLASKETQAA